MNYSQDKEPHDKINVKQLQDNNGFLSIAEDKFYHTDLNILNPIKNYNTVS